MEVSLYYFLKSEPRVLLFSAISDVYEQPLIWRLGTAKKGTGSGSNYNCFGVRLGKRLNWLRV